MPDTTAAARSAVPLLSPAGTAAALVASAFGFRVGCAVAVLLALIGEASMRNWGPLAADRLRRAGLGLSVRTALRFVAVVAVSRAGDTDAWVTAAVVATGSSLFFALALDNLMRIRMRRARTPTIDMRNIALDRLDVPRSLPGSLVAGDGIVRAALELPLLLAASLATTSGPIVAIGSVGTLAGLLLAVSMAAATRRIGERLRPESMIAFAQDFLDTYRPEVVLYFSGSATSVYQVNIWLATVEKLDRRAVVVLRERAVLRSLGPTTLPVLCIPGASHLMALDFDDARAGLFTANVGKNIHLLREPKMMTSFIGHGDSDKNASSNPVSRSFDEIWVAGEAGRDRYRRAQVGVREEQLVEIGRPQLDAVQHRVTRPEGWVPTVLYAPTWEGWNADQEYSSLGSIGRQLVRSVIEHRTPIRLIYKPHPLTGVRDPRMAALHRELVGLIAAANARGGFPTFSSAADNGATSSIRGDAADLAVLSGSTPGTSAVEADKQQSRADSEFFSSLPPAAHVVVQSKAPTLFSCFDQADVLVTDVSSLVSDFMISGKPYAVCNPSALDESEFVRMFPSAAAGVVIDSVGDGLATVLAVTAGELADPRQRIRDRQSGYLLGTDPRPATQRFAVAVDDLIAHADGRNASRDVVTTHGEIDLADEGAAASGGVDERFGETHVPSDEMDDSSDGIDGRSADDTDMDVPEPIRED